MCLLDGSHRVALPEVLDHVNAEGWCGAEINSLKAKWLSEVKLTMFDNSKILFQVAVFFFLTLRGFGY